jgi:succinoglycan biosynthesis protein ExoM
MTNTAPTRIVASICTYERNAELRHLLDSLHDSAARLGDRVSVGVVVVDDNADGRARTVVGDYDGRFALGVRYRHTAARNISIARNAGLETALEFADWIAMTDDDCVVPPGWFHEHLEVLNRFDADASGGSMILTFPPGSPKWLNDEPFGSMGLMSHSDGERVPRCGTNNSMLSAKWLREHPEVRFDPELGRLGGEDMVFYRTAMQAGLHARFAAAAPVYEQEPPSRATLRYQLSRAMWIGNTEFVTNHRAGDASRLRLGLRAMNGLRRALFRPVRRMISRERPQLRYTVAQCSQAAGLLIGALGREMEHR